MQMMHAVAFAALALALLCSRASCQSTQHLDHDSPGWTHSSTGTISIHIPHESSYQYALCLYPASNGSLRLQPTLAVHAEVLRAADVTVQVMSMSSATERQLARVSPQRFEFWLGPEFFRGGAWGEGNRLEVSVETEFKNKSVERFVTRFTVTCQHMSPPPPAFSEVSAASTALSHQPPLEEPQTSFLTRARGCITVTCLASVYRKFHAHAVHLLRRRASCARQTASAAAECADAYLSSADTPRIDLVVFRFISGAGWGNSVLLLMEAMLFALLDWRVLIIDPVDHEHMASQISSAFLFSSADTHVLCDAAGAALHTGTRMPYYHNHVFTSLKAAVEPSRALLVIIETAFDSVIPCLPVLQSARALLFPAALDILPPFPHHYLGAVARIALQPSPALRLAVLELQRQLKAAGCTRSIGIHLRGGFVTGDFVLHENRLPTSLARVVQAARQVAEEEDGPDNSLSGSCASDLPEHSKVCFVIAGDNADIRELVRSALQSWGFTAFDVSGNAARHALPNVGKVKSLDVARAALQEWFMLGSASSIIMQPQSSFGLSAGIYGGGKGYTVAEHRVINGFSCSPWYLDGMCALDDGSPICKLQSL